MANKKADKKNKNKLCLKIEFDGFKLDVSSDNPDKTLFELNKLIRSKKEFMEVINSSEYYEPPSLLEEDDISFEFRLRALTREIRANDRIMETIRNLTLKYGDFEHKKDRIEIKQEIDLNNKSLKSVVKKVDIKNMINKLLFDIDPKLVSHIIIHVIGQNMTKDHKYMILDDIKRKTGFAETSFLFTKKNIPGALVFETVIFGDLPRPREE